MTALIAVRNLREFAQSDASFHKDRAAEFSKTSAFLIRSARCVRVRQLLYSSYSTSKGAPVAHASVFPDSTMGQHEVEQDFDHQKVQAFMSAVLDDLRALVT